MSLTSYRAAPSRDTFVGLSLTLLEPWCLSYDRDGGFGTAPWPIARVALGRLSLHRCAKRGVILQDVMLVQKDILFDLSLGILLGLAVPYSPTP